jgi:D-cysteine desulfhydrase
MKRVQLCHAPTPIWRHPALDRLLGFELWVKRDDMTSGAAAGNKLRKLEYLLGDALARCADVVLTCGGAQSNHARSTAIAARELGLGSRLLLRTADPAAPPATTGNLLLERMVGAELQFITPDQYRERGVHLDAAAAELKQRGHTPYIIPEGGSNGLGALGYVRCVEELAEQQGRGELPHGLDVIALACGSGGTAAGVALGLGRYPKVAEQVAALAVCDDRPYFERVVADITAQARALDPTLQAGPLAIHDGFVGPGYGIPSAEQLDFMLQVARCSGLVLEPTYTGKALFGLAQLSPKPRRALFIHTGGLPGLLAVPELIATAWGRAAAEL